MSQHNASILTEENEKNMIKGTLPIATRSWQNKWDLAYKSIGVFLAFIIPISTALANIALPLLVISFFFSGSIKNKVQFIFNHPIAKLVLLFFSILLLGSFYSNGSYEDIRESMMKMSKVLYLLFLLPIGRDERWRNFAFWAFISAMAFTLLLGILKIYAGVPIPSRYTAACIFKNHIDTNLMMAFATFFIAHSITLDKRPLYRCLGILSISLMSFYVLWMCEGRSGYLVFVLLWGLFCWQTFRFNNISIKYYILGISGLAILLLAVFLSSSRFQKRFNDAVSDLNLYQRGNTQTSFGQRLEFLQETWYLAKEHPWLGSGTGSFRQSYLTHSNQKGLVPTRNPHNEYLNIFFQLGALGLISFLSLLGGMIKNSFRLPKTEQHLVQGLVLAMFAGCFINSWLMDFTSGYFFIALTAFCFSAYRECGSEL